VYISIFPQLLAFYGWVNGIYENVRAVYLVLISYVVTQRTLFIVLLLLSPFILYPLRKIKRAIYAKLEKVRTRRTYIKNEKWQIEELLRTDLDSMTIETLKVFVRELQGKLELGRKIKAFTRFEKSLLIQMEDARGRLRELKDNARVDELDFKKKRIQLDIQNLKEERERQRDVEEAKLREIASELKMYANNAFFKNGLFQEEIDILHQNGYEDTNEYDVIKKKVVPVLVKKIMNHTPTHTFLVWSVKRYLTVLPNVELIQQHDTRYPDITFMIGDYDYAIEIETGTLLRKKKMTAAKVDFLNRNYPGRWMFIVSNKNLLSQYRKLGTATPRSEVTKRLEEWAEDVHQF
jgi:hemerythrin